MNKSHVSRVRELYKLILRLHRSLPDELKILGDNYAREEFKRHKKCKPQEAQIFLNEWREYVVSISRQVAPTRDKQRPVDDATAAYPGLAAAGSGQLKAADQSGSAGGQEYDNRHVKKRPALEPIAPSMEARAVYPGQAEAVGGQLRAAGQQLVAAGGGQERAADQQQAVAGGGRERYADQQQAAVGGGQVRAKDQRQVATGGREAAGAAIGFEAVRGGALPRLGNDLDTNRIAQLSPDQLLNFYRLAVSARGGNPEAQSAEEPINEELRLAINGLLNTLGEAQKASINADISENNSEKAIKFADEARAPAENGKIAEAAHVTTEGKDPKLKGLPIGTSEL